MKPKHTPGPWAQHSEALFYLVNGPDGEAVAETRTSYRTKPEVEANARLIAAAPELLEALLAYTTDKRLILSAPEHAGLATEVANKMRAAIAKATGGNL